MNPQRLIMATLVVAVLAVVAILVVPRLGGAASAEGVDLALDTQPRKGAQDAPVDVVFFEDFLCPHCATFSETIVPRLEREYVEPGHAAIHFVNFVVIGPEAERIALVGECVAAQDEEAFWAFEDVAYRSQSNLNERRAIDLALEYASGLDEEALRTCVDEDERLQQVRDDNRIAQELGLGGTPSVLVDGEQVTATYDAVAQAIDAARAE